MPFHHLNNFKKGYVVHTPYEMFHVKHYDSVIVPPGASALRSAIALEAVKLSELVLLSRVTVPVAVLGMMIEPYG